MAGQPTPPPPLEIRPYRKQGHDQALFSLNKAGYGVFISEGRRLNRFHPWHLCISTFAGLPSKNWPRFWCTVFIAPGHTTWESIIWWFSKGDILLFQGNLGCGQMYDISYPNVLVKYTYMAEWRACPSVDGFKSCLSITKYHPYIGNEWSPILKNVLFVIFGWWLDHQRGRFLSCKIWKKLLALALAKKLQIFPPKEKTPLKNLLTSILHDPTKKIGFV